MTPAVDPKTGEPYTIAKDGFRATYYQMVGQYGTHVDPPAHPAELRRVELPDYPWQLVLDRSLPGCQQLVAARSDPALADERARCRHHYSAGTRHETQNEFQ